MLAEFDAKMGRMRDAYEYAENLGQYLEAARILYQMNEELPDGHRIELEELEDAESAKAFLDRYGTKVRSAISEYRQTL